MKFKFMKNANDNYGDFAGDDEYYGGGFDEVDAEQPIDDGFDAPAPAPEAAFGVTAAALKIVNPKGYEEASEIADYLMNGNTVLLGTSADHDNLNEREIIRNLNLLKKNLPFTLQA